MRPSLPKFASNNRIKGTAKENQAVVQGSFAAFGTYTVSTDTAQTVIQHYDGCSFPNWDGQDLKRVMTVKGDELTVTVPVGTIEVTNTIVYKRAK